MRAGYNWDTADNIRGSRLVIDADLSTAGLLSRRRGFERSDGLSGGTATTSMMIAGTAYLLAVSGEYLYGNSVA